MEVFTFDLDSNEVALPNDGQYKEVHILLQHNWVECAECGLWCHCELVSRAFKAIEEWLMKERHPFIHSFALKYGGYAKRQSFVEMLGILIKLPTVKTIALPSLPYNYSGPFIRPINLFLFHYTINLGSFGLLSFGVVHWRSIFKNPISKWYINISMDEIELAETLLSKKCRPVGPVEQRLMAPFQIRNTRDCINLMRANCVLLMCAKHHGHFLWGRLPKDILLYLVSSFLHFADWKDRQKWRTRKTSKYATQVYKTYQVVENQIERISLAKKYRKGKRVIQFEEREKHQYEQELNEALDLYKKKRPRIKI